MVLKREFRYNLFQCSITLSIKSLFTIFQFFWLDSTTFYDFRSIRSNDPQLHAKFGVVYQIFCKVRNRIASKIGFHGRLPYATFSIVCRRNSTLKLEAVRVTFCRKDVFTNNSRAGIAQSIERSPRPTNAWWQVCGRDQLCSDAGWQQVGRCSTRGESQGMPSWFVPHHLLPWYIPHYHLQTRVNGYFKFKFQIISGFLNSGLRTPIMDVKCQLYWLLTVSLVPSVMFQYMYIPIFPVRGVHKWNSSIYLCMPLRLCSISFSMYCTIQGTWRNCTWRSSGILCKPEYNISWI